MPERPSRVHSIPCNAYDADGVRLAIAGAFESFEAAAHLFAAGSRVLVKPNLLRPSLPDRAINTHPSVIVECVRLLRGRGCSVLVADSPGVGGARINLRRLGCLREIEETGAEVRALSAPRSTLLPGGKEVGLSADALEADAILNLPKWKTHVQVGITAAVKNLFGCLVGPRKACQHLSYGHIEAEFLEMLLDIAAVLKPALTIVDGVVAMEGDGPFRGSPKPVGYIFAGEDPLAIDRVLASLMGFGELRIFKVAREKGLGGWDYSKIEKSGAPLPERVTPPFVLPAHTPLTFNPLRRVFLRKCGPWETGTESGKKVS